ncbi:MAG: hypothetical protein AAFV53_30050 [Myxococcota bacterium]
MIILFSLLSSASATPIHGGELAGTFQDSAYTLPKGDVRLQIILPSSYGVTDTIEVSTAPLGLLSGPNASAEFQLFADDKQAVSVRPTASILWDGTTLSTGASAIYTLGGPETNRLNVSIGANYTTLVDDPSLISAISVGYDLNLNDRSMLQFNALVDPVTSINEDGFSGQVNIGYTRAWKVYRLQVGVVTINSGVVQETLDEFEIDLNFPGVLPLPYILMWWRI